MIWHDQTPVASADAAPTSQSAPRATCWRQATPLAAPWRLRRLAAAGWMAAGAALALVGAGLYGLG